MSDFGIQDLVTGINARMQKMRAGEQMTLGQLIEKLRTLPPDAAVALNDPRSYRGYYDDLAFAEGTSTVTELLRLCTGRCMGQVFDGYKGGEFVMHVETPIWVAEWGCLGDRLMGLRKRGKVYRPVTAPEDG